MRTRLTAALGVLLTALLTLSLTGATPAQAADATSAERARALAVLAELDAIFEPATAGRRIAPPPRKRGEPLPRRDVTGLFAELARLAPALPKGTRARAAQYQNRMIPGGCREGQRQYIDGSHVAGSPFRIEFTAGNREQALRTMDALNHAWNRLVNQMGYRPSKIDNDGLRFVMLCDLQQLGLYGYCQPDTPHATTSSAFCVLDDSYLGYGTDPNEALRVTAAHEFFHAVQYAYDVGEDQWFKESSAVWAETAVYPQYTDYVQYVRKVSPLTQPARPLDYAHPRGAGDIYSAALYWIFLAEKYGPATIRQVWEKAIGPRYSLQAVDAALKARGIDPVKAFALFGVWNTTPAGSYQNRGLFPAQPWGKRVNLNGKKKQRFGTGVTIDHLSTRTVLIKPKKLKKKTKLRLTFTTPNRPTRPAVTVQVRRKNGRVAIKHAKLTKRGKGALTVPFNSQQVASIVVGLTNASIRTQACGSDPYQFFACAGFPRDDTKRFGIKGVVKLPPKAGKKKRR